MFDSIMFPLSDAMDSGGGGGELLSDGSTGGSATPAPGFGGQGGGDGAQPIDINDDTLIRVKGVKEPVKYSDYIKGFVPKSDFTRAQQAKAAEVQRANEALRDREARLEQLQRSQQGNAQAQTNPVNDLVKQLEGKAYLSGQEAAGLVRQLWDGGIQKLAGAITQRDEIIKLMYNKLMSIDGNVGTMRTSAQEQALQSRFNAVKSQLSLPDTPEVDEFLADVYYSHEGEDLDSEFPNMVKARWESYQKLLRVEDQKRVQSARQGILAPGGRKGGNATPSNQLRNRTSRMDAKQLADEMWPLLGGGNT